MCTHVERMKSYIDKLKNLDIVFNENLAPNLMLGSFESSYDNFIMNYHLNSVDKTIMELYSLLQKAEVYIKNALDVPTNQVIAIQSGGGNK